MGKSIALDYPKRQGLIELISPLFAATGISAVQADSKLEPDPFKKKIPNSTNQVGAPFWI
jgi:hypothetical protein